MTADAASSSSSTTVDLQRDSVPGSVRPPGGTSNSTVESYPIKTSLILTRPALLTRKSTPFERGYYEYNQKLEFAMSSPFYPEFFFKRGSIGESVFQARERAWQSTLGTSDKKPSGVNEQESIAKGDAAYQDELNSIRPLPREPAASTGDMQSLNRKLDEQLILVIKRKDEPVWAFPSALVGEQSSAATISDDTVRPSRENLHQAAARALISRCGTSMNVWILTKAPVAHLGERDETKGHPLDHFFLKAHIMAGQAKVVEPVEEFMWLTKDEVEQKLSRDVWEAVKDAL